MKSFKIFLAAVAAIACASTASAQFVSGGSSRSHSSLGSSFQSAYISYSPTNFVSKYKSNSTTTSAKTITAGWAKDFPIAAVENLYYEVGAALQYTWDKDAIYRDEYEYSNVSKTSFIGVKVPISVAYKFNLNDVLSLAPYAGLDPTLFFIGKNKTTIGQETYDDYESTTTTRNYFNKDDMNNYQYSRFVINWHLGVKAYINDKFFAGIAYEAPIIYLLNKDGYKAGYKMTDISFGILF